MKTAGFTLIELMIVIAVVGVAFTFVSPSMQAILRSSRRLSEELVRQETITKVYSAVTGMLSTTAGIRTLSADRVVFDSHSEIWLERRNAGRTLVVKNSGGLVQTINMSGAMVFGPFREVDERTFSTQLRMHPGKSFSMYWRCEGK